MKDCHEGKHTRRERNEGQREGGDGSRKAELSQTNTEASGKDDRRPEDTTGENNQLLKINEKQMWKLMKKGEEKRVTHELNKKS